MVRFPSTDQGLPISPLPPSPTTPQEEDEPEAAGPEGDEEAGDGFFVDDGYFSEDEGMRDSQMEPGASGEGIAGGCMAV